MGHAERDSVEEIFSRRDAGEIRISYVVESSGDLSRVLSKFGLTPDKSMLVEQDRTGAFSILTELLWRDQAYRSECMPKEEAADLAERIISRNEREDSRYYSNRVSPDSWNSLTDSTFDAGIVISGSDGRYFCIWLEDED